MNVTFPSPIRVRDFISDPLTPAEIIGRFWETLYYKIDVDEIVYDLISDYDGAMEEQKIDGWYMEEDTDEKDSLRDEVLTQLGYPFL